MAGITKTAATRHAGQRSVLGDMANGLAIETGEIAMDSSYISNGGESLSFPGFASLAAVLISPRSGYMFEYDISNSKVIAWKSQGATATGASAVFLEAATATDLSGLSDVAYVAIGFV